MLQITNSKDNLEKKDEIVATAQKWFGQYGFKKTSMIEISNDLEMSKGLLYYYFPDKGHLYKAVVEKEFVEFKATLNKQLSTMKDPFEMLSEFTRLRLLHFRKLVNLSRFNVEEMKKMNAVFCKTRDNFQLFEKEVIVGILIEANKEKLLYVTKPDEIAGLILDILRGIRITMVKDKQFYFLSDEEFESLVKKTESFIDIFISGLKFQTMS
jgi:AcrR family transcriptional regulator